MYLVVPELENTFATVISVPKLLTSSVAKNFPKAALLLEPPIVLFW